MSATGEIPAGSATRSPGTIGTLMIHGVVGMLVLAALFLTVHDRDRESEGFDRTWVDSGTFQVRWTELAQHWIDDGYFANAGLWYLNIDRPFKDWASKPGIPNSGWISKENYDPEAHYYYRSNPVIALAPLAAAQRIKVLVAGGEASQGVTILYGQTLVMLTGCLVGVVATICCRRMGLPALHALALGVCAQIVFQTHPLNLAAYFRIFFQHALMLPAMLIVFSIVMHDRHRAWTWLRGIGMLLLTLAEPIGGVAFLLGYLILGILIDRGLPRKDRDGVLRSHRFGWTIALPCLIALGIVGAQILLARTLIPNAELVGGSSSLRTGLDGSTKWYTNLHGAFRGMFLSNYLYGPGRANIGGSPIFWVAGLASMAVVVLSAAWTRTSDRSHEAIRLAAFVTALLSTMFVILAVAFNNAMAIHPFIYPIMILPALCLATFAFLPAIVARTANFTWPVVATAILVAFVVSMSNLRYFAVTYPPVDAAVSARAPQLEPSSAGSDLVGTGDRT